MDGKTFRRDALGKAIEQLAWCEMRLARGEPCEPQSSIIFYRSELEQAKINYIETLGQVYEDNKDEIAEINDIDPQDHA